MQRTKRLFSKGIIHNPKMVTQSQFSQIQFQAVLNNFSMLYNVLKAVSFADNAMVYLSNDGIQVTVEDAKSIQASAYITRACFSEFKLNPRGNAQAMDGGSNELNIPFGLNLKVFTDCLSMFISGDYNSSLKMLQKGSGAPLIVILEQNGDDNLITECSVRTMDPFDCMELDVDDEQQIVSKINIKGMDFFLLLSEMDRNCDDIEIIISPDAPHLKFQTFGELHSEACVEITNSSDMLVTFNCTEASRNRYKFQHLKLAMRTLALSSKVALRTNNEGLLELQVMIDNNDSSHIFVKYFILPLVYDADMTTLN
ncbi:cell cycle checkpoint protein RAD1 [Anopheles ziemanni]|uniref:cell cycle checkpoint protein RAD1 n=1 Tax=Anopheles coustani TaxID=139045 RepID=UPI002658EFFC|nr:cell cycle checkpoint protein RAD1 [Anopheles coustani]XP_058174002.1 cell cycle checkpoint protein RAD1 [Anopheles ziemanni]